MTTAMVIVGSLATGFAAASALFAVVAVTWVRLVRERFAEKNAAHAADRATYQKLVEKTELAAMPVESKVAN